MNIYSIVETFRPHGILLTAVSSMCICALSGAVYLYFRNPLSIETKFCMIFNYVPKHIKDLEWTFVPQNAGIKQSRLIVSFAGGGVQIGGYSLAEFAKTVSRIKDCDALLLSDPLQLWYLSNYKELHAKLKAVTSTYSEVLFLGNCLGGSGALLYADLATCVLSFGPQTTLTHARGLYWLNSHRLDSYNRAHFEARINSAVSQCPGPCYAYFSPIKDTYMSAYCGSGVRVQVLEECTRDVVPQWLKTRTPGRDDLVPFIEQHFVPKRNK